MRANGSYVGRAAPEIDILEATVDGAVGKVSLSAQWAPYNVRHTVSCLTPHYEYIRQANYNWLNTTDNLIMYDTTKTVLNAYKGGKAILFCQLNDFPAHIHLFL